MTKNEFYAWLDKQIEITEIIYSLIDQYEKTAIDDDGYCYCETIKFSDNRRQEIVTVGLKAVAERLGISLERQEEDTPYYQAKYCLRYKGYMFYSFEDPKGAV